MTSSDSLTLERVETFLVERVADHCGLDPAEVDPGAAFVSFGLSSRDALLLAGDLATWAGRDLSATLAWEHPTIAQMARYLVESEASASSGS